MSLIENISGRAMWLLLVLAPLPLCYLLVHFCGNWQELRDLEEEGHRLQHKAMLLQNTENTQSTILSALKNPDPHYLDKQIESLVFLLPEIKKLEAIHSENGPAEGSFKRLQSLKGGGNRLVFVEEEIRSNALFQEVEERQQHPVELDEEDLKKLLCLIEGVTIWPYGPKEGKPQFLIKDFKLSKKAITPQEKVFVVTMQLIKREKHHAAADESKE